MYNRQASLYIHSIVAGYTYLTIVPITKTYSQERVNIRLQAVRANADATPPSPFVGVNVSFYIIK